MKCNDTEKLIKKGEAFANDRLVDFQGAGQNGNSSSMAEMTNDLLVLVNKVQENNKVLTSFIENIVSSIKYLTDRNLHNFFYGRALHLLVAAVDGNRDNFSYYMLDASAKWIELRVESTPSQVKSDFESTRSLLLDARDNLDSHAQVFIKGIKTIRKLSSGGMSGEHEQDIRAVVDRFQEMMQTFKLIEMTQTSIQKIESIINYLKQ